MPQAFPLQICFIVEGKNTSILFIAFERSFIAGFAKSFHSVIYHEITSYAYDNIIKIGLAGQFDLNLKETCQVDALIATLINLRAVCKQLCQFVYLVCSP